MNVRAEATVLAATPEGGPPTCFHLNIAATGEPVGPVAVGVIVAGVPAGTVFGLSVVTFMLAKTPCSVTGAPGMVKVASTFTSAGAGTYDKVDRDLGGRRISDVLYQNDIMTCASCHEVHNKENVVQDVGTHGYQPNYLLYAKEKDSLICLSCHIK